MKIKSIIIVVFAVFFSASCTPNQNIAQTDNSRVQASPPTLTPLPLATFTPVTSVSTVVLPQSLQTQTAGFVDDWRLRSQITPAIREYFYYRKKVIISGDVTELWLRYPELKSGADNLKGINAEEFFITHYQALKPIDGNVNLQAYERMKVKMQGNEAEVFVHGQMVFIWIDENGDFQDTGGEIKIVVYLRKNGEKWTIYKTDQYRQGAE